VLGEDRPEDGRTPEPLGVPVLFTGAPENGRGAVSELDDWATLQNGEPVSV
jgi:hypothetical protein